MDIIPSIDLTGVPVNEQAGFIQTVYAACTFYDILFTNNVTLNITFNYGAVAANDYAENIAQGDYLGYALVKSELLANAHTTTALTAWSTLSNTDPTNGGAFWVSEAQLKAWGLPYVAPPGSTNTQDGVVTLGNSVSWDFDPASRAALNEYDAVAALEHEISEVMGRVGIDGTGNVAYNLNNNTYTALDLFRYTTTASGTIQRTLTPGPGSFSIDGKTLLQTFNDPTILLHGQAQGGDLGDWEISSPKPTCRL